MFVAKLDLKSKIIVVCGGDLCVCERGFVHSVFYYIIIIFFLPLYRFPGHPDPRHKDFKSSKRNEKERKKKKKTQLRSCTYGIRKRDRESLGAFTRQRKNGTGPTKTGTVPTVFAKKQ